MISFCPLVRICCQNCDVVMAVHCTCGILIVWPSKNLKTYPFAYNEELDVVFLILCLPIRFHSERIPKTDISVSSAMSVGSKRSWSESPGILTFPGISHCCALPFEFLPLQALSPEKTRQRREQTGSHKDWRTGAVPGTVQCRSSGSRRVVPSPGKPGCSRTRRKQSFAPEGAAVLLAAW